MRCPSSADSLARGRSVQSLSAKSSVASIDRRQLLPASGRYPRGWPPFSHTSPLCRVARPFLRNNPPKAATFLSCSDLSRSTRSPLPTSSAHSAPVGTKSPLLLMPDLHTGNLERARRTLPKMPLVYSDPASGTRPRIPPARCIEYCPRSIAARWLFPASIVLRKFPLELSQR